MLMIGNELKLPSRGLLYGDKLPNGVVKVRGTMTEEEAVFFDNSLGTSQKVDFIIERCATPKAIPPKELLLIDRFAILVGVRMASFGADYEFPFRCPSCRETSKISMNIGEDLRIEYMGMDDDGNEIDDIREPFLVSLPDAGKEIKFRILRGADEARIVRASKNSRQKRTAPGDPSYLLRLAAMVEVDGQFSELEAQRFIRTLTSRDSRTLELAYDRVERGIDTTMSKTCPSCGAETEIDMPFTDEFFRPTTIR